MVASLKVVGSDRNSQDMDKQKALEAALAQIDRAFGKGSAMKLGSREARKTHPDLPILFISGYAEEQLRKSIDLERVAFLAKPFSVQKLAEAARDALRGGAKSA